MLESLKERVYRETLKLREYGLAVPTGGSSTQNISQKRTWQNS